MNLTFWKKEKEVKKEISITDEIHKIESKNNLKPINLEKWKPEEVIYYHQWLVRKDLTIGS